MGLSVQTRAENVATFRFIHVFVMETVARWLPRTPEMEVKVLFGRHIWDLAQQADSLGKRTYELRAPLQFSLRPVEAYVRFLEQSAATDTTPEKIGVFYQVILPGLKKRYQKYLETTDSLLDEPTVRVIERILDDFARMESERRTLLAELPQFEVGDAGKELLARLAETEASHSDIVAHRAAAAVA